MIYLDTREGGSKSPTVAPALVATLSSHRLRPPVECRFLHAGDFCFTGNGPNGPAAIGIERKRLSSEDFFRSIYSGRLVGEQLPKLIDLYDHCYLIVEGQARVDWETGELEEYRNKTLGWQKIGYRDTNTKAWKPHTGEQLLGMMNTVSTFTPVRIIRTFGVRDTLDVVATLWHWWQTPWTQHRSHRAIYTAQTTVNIGKASSIRRIAAQLNGVGWERSGVVESQFQAVMGPGKSMCKCPQCGYGSGAEEWEKLPGFGKVLSKRVADELAGMQTQNGTGD